MNVPEAAMHEDDFLAARKNDVRLAGQVRPMQFVLHLQCVEHRADDNLGLCVFTLDSRHAPASLLGCEYVHSSRQTTPDQIHELFHL